MKRKILSGALAGMLAVSAMGLTGCQGSKGKTLKWIQLGDKQPRHDEILAKVNEIVEPELGLKLEIEYIDTASFSEKSKMKMSSGENFDVIWAGYINDYQTAVALEGLMDITDYLDKIQMADGTTAKMSDVVEDYFLDAAKIDGKI